MPDVSSDSEEDSAEESDTSSGPEQPKKTRSTTQSTANQAKTASAAAKSKAPAKSSAKGATSKPTVKPAAKKNAKAAAPIAKEVTSKKPSTGEKTTQKTQCEPSKRDFPASLFSTETDLETSLTVAEIKEKENHMRGYIGELGRGPVKAMLLKGTPGIYSAAQRVMNSATYAPISIPKYTLKEKWGNTGKDTPDNESVSSKNTCPETSTSDLCPNCWTTVTQLLIQNLGPSRSARLSSSSQAIIHQKFGSRINLSTLFEEFMTLYDLNGKIEPLTAFALPAENTSAISTQNSDSKNVSMTNTQKFENMIKNSGSKSMSKPKLITALDNQIENWEFHQKEYERTVDLWEKEPFGPKKEALEIKAKKLREEAARLHSLLKKDTRYSTPNEDADPNDVDGWYQEVSTDEEEE